MFFTLLFFPIPSRILFEAAWANKKADLLRLTKRNCVDVWKEHIVKKGSSKQEVVGKK
jgi:hypothetical protein